MKIAVRKNGSNRKDLVREMCEILGETSRYLGAPSMAYKVGRYTLTRNSELECEDENPNEVRDFLRALLARGFELAEGQAFPWQEGQEDSAIEENAEDLNAGQCEESEVTSERGIATEGREDEDESEAGESEEVSLTEETRVDQRMGEEESTEEAEIEQATESMPTDQPDEQDEAIVGESVQEAERLEREEAGEKEDSPESTQSQGESMTEDPVSLRKSVEEERDGDSEVTRQQEEPQNVEDVQPFEELTNEEPAGGSGVLQSEEVEAQNDSRSEDTVMDSGMEEQQPERQQETDDSVGTEPRELKVEMPRAFYTEGALERLRKLVDSKAALIRKSVGAEELPIEVTEDKVIFPWFHVTDSDEVKAYSNLISKISIKARDAKRITAKEREVESEKYAFRVFLLSIGFVGDAYRTDRRILLKRLSGTAAFPTRVAAEEFALKQKEKREAAKAASPIHTQED